MKRDDVKELYNIVSIENLSSILQLGLLSYELCINLKHLSVASPIIQNRRVNKTIPGGLPLHHYANLYFDARNPMLYTLRGKGSTLCILRIDSCVLDIPGVIITSQNASSDYVRFYPSPEGLKYLDREAIYAESWIHTDQIEEWRHKSIKCAEVLVPNRVDLVYIIGGYVSNIDTQNRIKFLLKKSGLQLDISIDEYLFFLGNRND